MADKGYTEITDLGNLIGQSVPPEVLEQLQVLGRVEFPIKPTSTSAISSTGEEFVHPDEQDAAANISAMIDHVGDMEDLTKQMEDLIDELTKDMNIPVEPDSAVADAVKTLGGTDAIDRDVFDTALAIIDHTVPLTQQFEPVILGLTGNGKLRGPWMNCDEITRGVSKAWNTAEVKTYTPEQPVVDASTEIANDFEESKANMILEMIQMLWWNIIWAKYTVDLAIINPARIMFAYPIDRIILFFKRKCGVRIFKRKPKDCLKQHGPINRILNKLRCILLCEPPKALWHRDLKRYKPMVEDFDCDCTRNRATKCPENLSSQNIDEDGDISEMGSSMNAMFPDNEETCVDIGDLLENADTLTPDKLGASPECLQAAQLVLKAVEADALSPADPTKKGQTGSKSIGAILQGQIDNIGVNNAP